MRRGATGSAGGGPRSGVPAGAGPCAPGAGTVRRTDGPSVPAAAAAGGGRPPILCPHRLSAAATATVQISSTLTPVPRCRRTLLPASAPKVDLMASPVAESSRQLIVDTQQALTSSRLARDLAGQAEAHHTSAPASRAGQPGPTGRGRPVVGARSRHRPPSPARHPCTGTRRPHRSATRHRRSGRPSSTSRPSPPLASRCGPRATRDHRRRSDHLPAWSLPDHAHAATD